MRGAVLFREMHRRSYLVPLLLLLVFLALAITGKLIVDQMADHVLAIADRGYVIAGGRVVAQGEPAGLRDAMLDDAYLGTHPAVVN